jgi:hypothetical protein
MEALCKFTATFHIKTDSLPTIHHPIPYNLSHLQTRHEIIHAMRILYPLTKEKSEVTDIKQTCINASAFLNLKKFGLHQQNELQSTS